MNEDEGGVQADQNRTFWVVLNAKGPTEGVPAQVVTPAERERYIKASPTMWPLH